MDKDFFDQHSREIAWEVLSDGRTVRFRSRGDSMQPFILDLDLLQIANVEGGNIRLGDIVVFQLEKDDLLVHRVVRTRSGVNGRRLLVQGDAILHPDGWIDQNQVLGKVVAIQRSDHVQEDTNWKRLGTPFIRLISLQIALFLPVLKEVYRCSIKALSRIDRPNAPEKLV